VAVATFPCKSHTFRKRVRKVIPSEEKWRVFKGCDETSRSAGKWKMGSEEKWSEVLIFGEMCVFSLIDSYVAVCMFCAVRCVCVSLLFASVCYWLITRFRFFNILFMFVFLFCLFVFYFVYSVFLYCFVYCFSFCI
jgi:hypothetical protein